MASLAALQPQLDELFLQDEVESAIAQLDKRERRAYQTAVEVVPHLVHTETKVMDFLRVEDFDISRTAQRLAAYWNYRKAIFGDRWLLPMSQTGTGTLSETDIRLLRTGYQALFSRLHDTTGDHGLLIIVDFAKVTGVMPFDSDANVRIVFYLATVLTDPVTQTDGATVVYVVRSAGMPPVDTNPEGYRIVHQALPVRMKQLIVARAFVEGKEGVLNYLAYQTARVNQFRSGMQPKQLISNSTRGTLYMLEEKGVQRQYLPRCLGGDWTPDKFQDWVRMRLSLEDIMAPAPLKLNFIPIVVTTGPTASLVGKRQRRGQLALANAPALSGAIVVDGGGEATLESNDNDGVETKVTVQLAAYTSDRPAPKKSKKKPAPQPNNAATRELNALYSRRAYHKRKLKVVALEQKVHELETQKKRLQTDARQLDSALYMARQLIGAGNYPIV